MKGFIAVDGGGSKTEVVLVNVLGHVLAREIVNCSNPNDVGMEQTYTTLNDVLKRLLEKKEVEVTSIFLAIAGIEFGNSKELLKQKLTESLNFNNIHIDGDLASVKELGLGNYKDGVVVIAGTGFNMAIKNNFNFSHVGGWGYLADDFFSGFDLGKEALVRASRAINGIDKDTQLISLLESHFNNSLWYSMAQIYNEGIKGVASLSRLVFEAYLNNDEVAKEIVDTRINKLVDIIKDKTSKIISPIRICLFGGIFENNSFIVDKMKALLGDSYIVEVTNRRTIYGAVSLGIKSIKEPNEEFYINFNKSYKEWN